MSKGGAMSLKEVLLKKLEHLGDEELKKLKWFLQQSDILGGLPVITKSQLEKADRMDTVDKIIQTYDQQSAEVVKKILEKMKRGDLVKELSSTRTGAQETDLDQNKLSASQEDPLRPSVVKASEDALLAECREGSRTETAEGNTLAHWSINISPTYKDIISNSTRIRLGPPALCQLKPNKEKFGTLTRISVGEKDPAKTNKTILLVGETRAGKSTLINALVNYAMGVKWEDDVWFQIVEDEKRSQSESQTSDVIVYQIFGFEDKTLPYSLTIIDTPGYGDTRGTEQDDIVSQRLLDLFRSEDGVHEINAVGLVLKATENHLSDRLRYIFDSVVSLFGKNMEKNIVALITHSDGVTPEDVLQALEDAKMKCAKDEENQPVYFMFNNHQSKQKTEKNKAALKYAWDFTKDQMAQFIDFLKKASPQKLMTTVEVLNSRIRLTACIQNLQEQVEFIELKQKEIQQTQKALKKHEREMKRNEKFTVEVDEVYKDKLTIDGGTWGFMSNRYKGATCCFKCEENCHYPGCVNAWYASGCEKMKDGRCTVCTGKCPASYHVKERWIYVDKTRKVQKTLQDVKEKYEKSKTDCEETTKLLENLEKEIEELEKDKDRLLEESFQVVVKLEQIALNVDSLSTQVHLDFLIEKMKEKGDAEKVQKLEEMKSRQDKGVLAALRYMRCSELRAAGKAMKN